MKIEIKVYSDGGARGNPGPAAVGVVAYKGSEELFRISKCIGKTTNNVAEYSALICALEKIIDMNCTNHQVIFHLDSELVVKQLNGEYKVKDQNLKLLYDRALTNTGKISCVQFKHIRREQNKIADMLVNKALDNEGS